MHPFYSDLLNVLYDKDHFKLALGQLNTARNLIDKMAKGAAPPSPGPQPARRTSPAPRAPRPGWARHRGRRAGRQAS